MKKVNIYYLGLFMICLKNWEYISKLINFDNILGKIINLIIILIFGFCIFNRKYNKKEILLILVSGIVLLINSLYIKEYIFFLDYLAILASKNVKINNIIKFIFKFNVAIIISHFFITIFSILLNINANTYITNVDGVNRYNFYMRHTNYFAAVIFWTLGMYIFLNDDKSIIKKMIIICITGIISYILTKSRTSLILYIAFILLIIVNRQKRLKRIIPLVARYSFIALSIVLSFITINFFNFKDEIYEVFLQLNKILSYRIVLGVVGYYNYGWTFLGQSINYLEKINANEFYIDTLVVDSFYISCLINYGIIILVILTFGFYRISKKIDNKYLIFIILLIIAAISERYIPYICVTFPILFLKYAIFEKNANEI